MSKTTRRKNRPSKDQRQQIRKREKERGENKFGYTEDDHKLHTTRKHGNPRPH